MGRHVGDALTSDGNEKYQSAEVQVKASALRIVFMRPMNAIALHNITKRFGTHLAVDDLSLEVPAGSVYGFIGPNGSGKTTTIRMILHILLPDSGRIEVFGDATHRPGARQNRVFARRTRALQENEGPATAPLLRSTEGQTTVRYR